jgi:hypothetical protein
MLDADALAEIVSNPDFERRYAELFARIEAGECVSIAEGAEALGVSVAAMVAIWNGYAAACLAIGRCSRTLH